MVVVVVVMVMVEVVVVVMVVVVMVMVVVVVVVVVPPWGSTAQTGRAAAPPHPVLWCGAAVRRGSR